MTGHPAVSLPCGFGADGLPIGLQLVGQFRGDAELLRVSALFEASQIFSAAGRPGRAERTMRLPSST